MDGGGWGWMGVDGRNVSGGWKNEGRWEEKVVGCFEASKFYGVDATIMIFVFVQYYTHYVIISSL